ncbi:unnamed protein product [Urochloa humidicola]
MLEEGEPSSPIPTKDKGKEPDLPSPCTPPGERGVHISPSIGPCSKALLAQAILNKNKQAVVDSNIRRSDRKKQQQKGFKHNTCLDKNCLGCNSRPPIISPSLIKNLGILFCKIDASKLNIDGLSKKKKATTPGGKKPAGKSPPKEDDEDAAKAKRINKRPPKK